MIKAAQYQYERMRRHHSRHSPEIIERADIEEPPEHFDSIDTMSESGRPPFKIDSLQSTHEYPLTILLKCLGSAIGERALSLAAQPVFDALWLRLINLTDNCIALGKCCSATGEHDIELLEAMETSRELMLKLFVMCDGVGCFASRAELRQLTVLSIQAMGDVVDEV